MTEKRIALLTYKDEPKLADSEQLLPLAFKDVGIEAVATPWDGDVNWKDYSTIILRACWNYHLNRGEFIKFLEQQSAEGMKIWNPLETVIWNTDKHYLLDLESKGVNTIPSVLIEPSDNISLAHILTSQEWQEAIIKPTIGASAHKVKRFNIETALEVEGKMSKNHSWLVQKFCPEINTEGEYSLMFFDREYSHSVMKKPKDGDFRTQPHYGGIEWEVEPEKKTIKEARKILDKVYGELLYARVDGLVLNGSFHLMELELAEPYMFFGSHPKASQRFVEKYKELSK